MQQIESLREKLNNETQQLTRQLSLYDQSTAKVRTLEEENSHLDSKIHKLNTELNSCEITKEGLKRDKNTVTIQQFFICLFLFSM